MRTRVLSIAIALCTLATACGDEPAARTPRKRGVQLPPEPPPAPARPDPQAPTAVPMLPNEAPSDWNAEPSKNQPERETLTADEAAPDEPEKAPRNFSSELASMIGSPVNCLAPRTAKEAPAEVRITLSASVMPSGTVSRGEVSAPDLSTSELECVKKRLESLRFAPPIENAPFTVNGSITLRRGG